jgi:hypothetical protein
MTALPRCFCGRLMQPTDKRFIEHSGYGRLYHCRCGIDMYFDDEITEKGEEEMGKSTQTIISLEQAIKQAVAENKVVQFYCDAPNRVLRDSIRFVNLQGCKICKDTSESSVVNVIPETAWGDKPDGKKPS